MGVISIKILGHEIIPSRQNYLGKLLKRLHDLFSDNNSESAQKLSTERSPPILRQNRLEFHEVYTDQSLEFVCQVRFIASGLLAGHSLRPQVYYGST